VDLEQEFLIFSAIEFEKRRIGGARAILFRIACRQ
jgi:hypothetical protein